MTFYKGLLDKLGLQFDALQMGKYKGVVEPMTRNEMSKPLRESFDALVDDIYDDLVATIGADRHMKDYKVKTLLDQGLFTAAAAQKGGLIDDVLYADQVQDAIKKALKTRRRGDRHRLQEETDRHRLLRHLRHDEAFGTVHGRKAVGSRRASKQKIAVVYAVGPIMEGKSQSDFFGNTTIGSTTIVAALRKAAERRQGGRHRAADRQPWRLGRGQRPDLAGNGPRPANRSSPA